jgi:hypothetical protein
MYSDISLEEMDDFFSLEDYDRCLVCCPRGSGSGYLGKQALYLCILYLEMMLVFESGFRTLAQSGVRSRISMQQLAGLQELESAGYPKNYQMAPLRGGIPVTAKSTVNPATTSTKKLSQTKTQLISPVSNASFDYEMVPVHDASEHKYSTYLRDTKFEYLNEVRIYTLKNVLLK